MAVLKARLVVLGLGLGLVGVWLFTDSRLAIILGPLFLIYGIVGKFSTFQQVDAVREQLGAMNRSTAGGAASSSSAASAAQSEHGVVALALLQRLYLCPQAEHVKRMLEDVLGLPMASGSDSVPANGVLFTQERNKFGAVAQDWLIKVEWANDTLASSEHWREFLKNKAETNYPVFLCMRALDEHRACVLLSFASTNGALQTRGETYVARIAERLADAHTLGVAQYRPPRVAPVTPDFWPAVRTSSTPFRDLFEHRYDDTADQQWMAENVQNGVEPLESIFLLESEYRALTLTQALRAVRAAFDADAGLSTSAFHATAEDANTLFLETPEGRYWMRFLSQTVSANPNSIADARVRQLFLQHKAAISIGSMRHNKSAAERDAICRRLALMAAEIAGLGTLAVVRQNPGRIAPVSAAKWACVKSGSHPYEELFSA